MTNVNDRFDNAALVFSASRRGNRRRPGSVPLPLRRDPSVHSKDLKPRVSSEEFIRLFHAATWRDKIEVIEGAKLMNILETRRRDLVAGPLVAMAAMALGVKLGKAAGVDPTMTIVTRPDEIPWKPLYNFPPGMAESANMFGDIHAPGQYFVLIRWHPGYMSAPHWYETDRLCVVMSGTWYVASGEDFAPDATVPVPAGSFVHRVAKTPHYDGVKKGATESAIIAISGIGPITYHLTDPTKPGWREV
jgi:hypothetical protein